MNCQKNTCQMNSVTKKIWVALTGIALSLFVLIHMSGNLLLLISAEKYNKYAHALTHSPILYPAEFGLVAIFILHIYFAVSLNLMNKKAKGISPKERASCQKAARFGSQYMVLTGLVVFLFVLFHLKDFKYGEHFSVVYEGVEMRDLHKLVVEEFHELSHIGIYLISLLALGIHLSHGFSALFQTLGISSVKNCCIKKIGWAFALFITLGFMIQPLYIFFLVPEGGGH